MKYFSTKRNRVFALTVLALVAVAFVLFALKDGVSQVVFERDKSVAAKAEFELLANKDSDGDGLRDWEEALWKTDPNNPDSDGDGTTDGEETRVGRDPAKPAPGDIFEVDTIVNKTVPNGEKYVPPTTATGILVEDFFKQYLELKKTGDGKVTPESTAIFVDSIMKNISLAKYPSAVEHKMSELKILSGAEDTQESLRAYGNEVARVFIESVGNAEEHEVDIINEAFAEGEDTEEGQKIIERITPVISDYKSMISKLLAMEVPQSVASIHLDMINEYEKIATALRNISVFFTDTILGLSGISSYEKSTRQIVLIGEGLTTIFSQNGIVFGNNELGALFFNTK